MPVLPDNFSKLTVPTRVLNNDLADDFHRWYPGFTHTTTTDALDNQLVAAA
jgi:hypothetical protein